LKRGVIVALVIGIAAALGFFLQQRQSHEQMPAVSATAAVSAGIAPSTDPADTAAATTPPAADARPALVVPRTLPQFELADRDGRKHKLSDWKGRPVMVNYWATWCGPCRREIPLLNQLRVDHKALKLEIIGIAVDFREDVLKYAQEHPISYPLLIDDDENLVAMKGIGMPDSPFPFTVFADSQQRILTVKVGELHREDVDLILGLLVKVDAGTLQVPAARAQISEGLKELATRRATAKPAAG
jgi:thiol-disulfide isomerase/thioredoxin